MEDMRTLCRSERWQGLAHRYAGMAMKKNESISKIMSRHVITLTHGDTISKVRSVFTDSGVGHLPVVNNGALVGIVSWTDLMRVSFGDAFGESTTAVDATLDHTMTLEQLMQADPVTLDHTGTIREAAAILSEADFHSLPIVDGTHLVGIVTSKDLISYLSDLL